MRGHEDSGGVFFHMKSRVLVRDTKLWSMKLRFWDREEAGGRELRMALRKILCSASKYGSSFEG